MRRARIALATGGFVALLAACVGGPGPLPDQGIDQASQGGGIQGDPSSTTEQTSSAGGNDNSGSKPEQTRPPVMLRASDYDQDCEVDSDCVAVFEGEGCTACRCPNAAISTQDATKYATDVQNAAKDCPARGDVACASCQNVSPGCNPDTKKCALGVTSSDGG